MSYGNRNDFGQSKPIDRLTRPRTDYPTTNVESLVMVEDVLVTADFVPLYYGQARDDASNLKLVAQKEIEGDGGKQYMRRVWATDRNAQDAEALAVKYTSDHHTYPVYIRRYIEPDPVTPLTVGTALTAVIGITITNGGSGYTSAPTLSFSGGGGSGAAAKCQIRGGVIVGVQMTASGTGYTSAPTVALTGGNGTGGAFTASIQPQTALLISQEQSPVEDEIGSLYSEVTRVWMVMPQLSDDDAKTFGYKIEFPYGVLDFPRVTWRMPTNSQSTATPLSGTCPISGYTGLLLIGQTYEKENGVVVAVTRIYENNPGPMIFESEYDERIEMPIFTTKQIVAEISVPQTAAALNEEINGYTSVGTAITNITSGLVTTSGTHGLAAGDEGYFPSLVGESGDIIEGNATGVGEFFVIATGLTSTQFRVSTTKGGASATGSATSGSAFKKRNLPRGTIREYKAMGMDKLRSIQITQKVDIDGLDILRGGVAKTYYAQHRFTFPDELISAEWYGAQAYNDSNWTIDLALHTIINQGYTGPCAAIIREFYTSNPGRVAAPAITGFSPEAVAIPFAFWYWSDTQVKAQARTFSIPPTLHGAITITVAGGGNLGPDATGGSALQAIPGTSPSTAVSANPIVVAYEPTKFRFGLTFYREIKIYHPDGGGP